MDLAVLEPIQHGSPEKNIGFYNHVFPGNEHDTWGDFIAHWHAEYEFIYVYQGPVSFILDNKVISVKTGQALFIDKNTIHASITPDISNPHYICITFGEQFLFPSTLDALYQEYFFPVLSENKQIPSRIKGDSIWEKKILQLLNRLCDSGFRKSRGCELEWRILIHTADSITDIAISSGFNDINYFPDISRKYIMSHPASTAEDINDHRLIFLLLILPEL